MKPDMQENMHRGRKRRRRGLESSKRPGFLKYVTPALVEVLTYVVNGQEKQSVMLKILPDIE